MNTLYKKALLLAGGVLVLLGGCILILLLRQDSVRNSAASYTACVYQDGRLLQSIPLDQAAETYHFTLEAAAGGYNIIEVSPGGIAITEADCPDQLCVLQGRITDSLLPITCLPHRLVIELKPSDSASFGSSPDAVAY